MRYDIYRKPKAKEDESLEKEADMTIELLHEFINVENREVSDEHKMEQKLYSYETLYSHLEDNIYIKIPYLTDLNCLIYEGILEIRSFLEENQIEELKIIKDDNKTISKLEEDVGHRGWVLVKKDIKNSKSNLKKFARVEIHEINKLRLMINKLVNQIKRNSRLIKDLDKNIKNNKEKKEFLHKEEYYLTEIYKFLLTYMRIFRHLWKKEKILSRKI